MEKALETLNRPDQDIKGHEFTRNSSWKKAMSFFLQKFAYKGITPNQISNLLIYNDMKKHLALILTFTAFLMTACEETYPEISGGPMDTIPPIAVDSIYPTEGAPGSTVGIFGENFGALTTDNYVMFDSAYAEIIYVGHRIINARVPMNLVEGDYAINVIANGRAASAPRRFTVISGTN
jgi:hypothetical protein